MKNLLYFFCLSICFGTSYSQPKITISDFQVLNNTNWKGSLTYLDYQSGEQNTIDTELQIKIDKETVIYNQQYTYEPNKNNASKVKIKKEGTYYGNEQVVSNSFKNGKRTITTSYKGKDNGEHATMYITRTFDTSELTITKKVKYDNASESFVRNTYLYNRINN